MKTAVFESSSTKNVLFCISTFLLISVHSAPDSNKTKRKVIGFAPVVCWKNQEVAGRDMDKVKRSTGRVWSGKRQMIGMDGASVIKKKNPL